MFSFFMESPSKQDLEEDPSGADGGGADPCSAKLGAKSGADGGGSDPSSSWFERCGSKLQAKADSGSGPKWGRQSLEQGSKSDPYRGPL